MDFLITDPFAMKPHCPNKEDYSHCKCRLRFDGGKRTELKCTHVSIKKIKEIFNRTNSTLIDDVFLQPIDYLIPEDIFVNHGVSKISLGGKNNNPNQYRPQVHPKTFRSCRNISKHFIIDSLDMSKMNLSFLTGFHLLTKLELSNVINSHLLNLPLLPNLKELIVSNTTELNKWTNFSIYLSGLEKLILERNRLSHEEVDLILKWIASSGPTRKTLNYLDLSGNALTLIPGEINFFNGLQSLILDNQLEPGFGVVPAFSLSFRRPVNFLNLSSCHITDIQPGAFQGNLT